MGFRTVVMLNNDRCSEWSKDPALGKKIQRAMNYAGIKDDFYGSNSRLDGYGQVVECTHADVQTLVVLEHYTGFEPVAQSSWYPNQQNRDLELVRQAAAALGYRLVKKATPKKT